MLVAIDFSEQSQRVLDAAEGLVKAARAHLWLVHIADPDPEFVGYAAGPDTVRHQVAKKLQGEHARLQEIAGELRESGLDATALSVQGPAVDRILSEAAKLDADLIVMGSHGHGAFYRGLIGSVSEGVLHRTNLPVMIIPPERR